MALIKKREHSLRTILLSYVVSLTVLSVISSLLILYLFSLSFRFGVVIPANQVESDLSAVRSDIETSKVVFITDEQKAPEQIERIKNIFPELSVMRSKGRLIEVYTRHASKGNALKHIVEKMGF